MRFKIMEKEDLEILLVLADRKFMNVDEINVCLDIGTDKIKKRMDKLEDKNLVRKVTETIYENSFTYYIVNDLPINIIKAMYSLY